MKLALCNKMPPIVVCRDLSDPPNGQVVSAQFTAMYTCNSGYILVGDNTQICQPDGKWSGSQPNCSLDAVIGSVVTVLVTVLVTVMIIVCCIFYRWKKLKRISNEVEAIELIAESLRR